MTTHPPTAAVGRFPYPMRTVAEVDAGIDPNDLDIIRTIRLKRTSSPMVARIQSVVAAHFGIANREMQSARQSRVIARPRQVAMYLARELTPKSLPEIGRRFGNRDHTTVIHACRQIERLITEDPELRASVHVLREELRI